MQRYVYPLVAPPTPEKLEQDKQQIEEQFDRAFALVEQLAKDTEELKTTEQQRSEKLDNALSELETVMADLKTANRRRDDDAQRIREEIQGLKDAIPKIGCKLEDVACACKPDAQAKLLPLVSGCILSKCSPADVAKAQSAANKGTKPQTAGA